MFDVTLSNQSPAELLASNGDIIKPNANWTYAGGPQGQVTSIQTPFGHFGFIDIGDEHIPGDDPVGEWGILLEYQEMSIVGRYNGQGTLNIVVDQYLQFQLSGMSFRQVALDGMVIVQPTVTEAA